MQCVEFICVPGSVQDVGNWGKNLHWSEDWDSPVYWATEREREREIERGDIGEERNKKDRGGLKYIYNACSSFFFQTKR